MATKTTRMLERLKKAKQESRKLQNRVDFAKAISTEKAIQRVGRNV